MKTADEVWDAESMGITIDGASVSDIRKIISYYKKQTHDLDLERVDFFARGAL